MNDLLFLEILDWNAKMVQCSNNIELSVTLPPSEINLIHSVKIKRPKRPLPGQTVPLVARSEIQPTLLSVIHNLLYLREFFSNLQNINQSLVVFNEQMESIHKHQILSKQDTEYIYTVSKILSGNLPKMLQHKKGRFGLQIGKLKHTLEQLAVETDKEQLNYQKEFSQYLVNCFNYIFNAMQQIQQRIDRFYQTKDYINQKKISLP